MSKKTKAVKSLAVAALVTSAIVPVASANTELTYTGVTVSVDGKLLTLSKADYNLAVVMGQKLPIQHIVVDGKLYSKPDYDLQVVLAGKAGAYQALVTKATPVTVTTEPGKFEGGKIVPSTQTPETGVLKVESVSAINGTVTANFSGAGTPTGADFTVSRTINGGTATAVTPTVSYNSTTKVATLLVPAVAQTNVAQTVVYTVNYKGTTQTASFVVAAPSEAGSVVAVGANPAATAPAVSVKVFFSKPVDETTAKTLANYSVTQTGGTSAIPNSISLNSTAVGNYAPGQVATLTFSGGVTAGNISISNVKTTNGVVIPTVVKPYLLAGANDATAPATLTITGLTVNGTAVTSVTKGTDVTIAASATDAASAIAGVEYRIVNAAGSQVVGWTNLQAVNAPFDTVTEAVTGVISTKDLATGTYTIQTRAIDVAGNVMAAADYVTTNLAVTTSTTDVNAPTITAQAGTYSVAAVTAAATKQGARTVRIAGTATDTINAGATGVASVKNVEYRVREYNTVTGAYTVVSNWASAIADDSIFDNITENYSFVTPELVNGKSYVIETRSTDAAGNVGPAVALPFAGLTAQAAAATPVVPLATLVTVATAVTTATEQFVAGTFTVAKDTTAPTVTGANIQVGGANTTATTTYNSRSVSVVGTATEAGTVVSGLAKVEYTVYRDNGTGTPTVVQAASSQGASVNANTGAVAIDYTFPAQDGSYEIRYAVIDGAGNKSIEQVLPYILDVNSPTASMVPNTSTVAKNDFVVTFSEAVQGPAAAAIANTNFQIVAANGVAIAPTSAITVTASNGSASSVPLPLGGSQYIVTVDTADVLAGRYLEVIGVTDVAGNISTTKYTFQTTDVQ